MDENRIANTALHPEEDVQEQHGQNQHWQDMKWTASTEVLMEIAQDRNRWRLMSTNARAYTLTCLYTEIWRKKKNDT